MLITDATFPDGRVRDLRVVEERIDEVGSLSPRPDEQVVDAADLNVFPGAIDVHVHFREPGGSHKETWTSGSQSAVAGGVTTVADQPNTDPPTVTGGAFDEKADLASASHVDFGINGGVTGGWDPETLFDRPLFALGEVFLADSTGEMGIGPDLFESAVDRAAAADCPVTVHAEDETLFDDDALSAADDGIGRDADADAWSAFRRAEAEAASIEHALSVADPHGVDLHIAHTSTPEGIDLAAEAGATCEVSPHHLYLSREDLPDLGTLGRMNPPLRSEERRSAVYDRVQDGTVDVIATDHAPHTRSEKEASIHDAPSGVPGVETMLPLLLADVVAGRLSAERVADLVARNPAAIFDLPNKGRLEAGRDADLVLVDLDRTEPVRAADLHTACEWTPFEGCDAVFPVATLLRGSPAYVDTAVEAVEPIAPSDGSFGPARGENVRE